MRFWDTSALVPLLVHEPRSSEAAALLRQDSGLVVWWATRTECMAALARRSRESILDHPGELRARRTLQDLMGAWSEVQPVDGLRRSAERLLGVHALTTGDAFQLAAALAWARDGGPGAGFVCLDARLGEAAHREGFLVLPE